MKPPTANMSVGQNFWTPPTQIAPQAKKFETPLLGELGNLRVLGAFAREARGNFYEFLPLKTAFLVNFGYVCSIIFETPLGQIGEFLRIFETPPTRIGPWARIFETPQRNWSPEATLKDCCRIKNLSISSIFFVMDSQWKSPRRLPEKLYKP